MRKFWRQFAGETERASIQQANLIPPGLLAGDPDAHLPYILMRENVINRIYDQNVGYWQPDLQGVDYLSRADRGSLLVDYLGVSERQLVKATERMIADGKYELAATALAWTKDRFAGSKSLAEVERLTYLKLMEKYQEFNPFKFIIYSGRIGDPTPQIGQGQFVGDYNTFFNEPLIPRRVTDGSPPPVFPCASTRPGYGPGTDGHVLVVRTFLRLYKARTVAWGLLNWANWVRMIVVHSST